MKTQIQFTLCFTLVFFLTNFTSAQTTFPVAVSLSGDQRDMQPDFFGFNGMRTTSNNLSWNDFSINDANSYWPVNPFHQFDPGHLRYPGGGVGNYWDFRKGWFIDQNQIPAGMELEAPYNSAFPGSPTFDDKMNSFKTTGDLTTAISNVCPGCVNSTLTLDDINCNTYTGTIYINGRHRVTKNVNLKNCSVKFGE